MASMRTQTCLAREVETWHSEPIKKKHRPSSAEDESQALASEVADLREEVRVLRDAIDDFRMEIEYLNRNGIRLNAPEGDQSVLRMKGISRREKEDAAESADCPTEPKPTDDSAISTTTDKPSDGRLF